MSDLTTYAYHMGRILKVLVYIESHLDEELSLEKMAKIAIISPFYFHRLFRAYMGETLAEYIKRIRLQHAAERLQYFDIAITDIALDLGYGTPSAFTKVFKQVMGKSPRQYRKVMQPLIQAIMKRTIPDSKEKAMLKPAYIIRKEETILFVRRVGDYEETPSIAFHILIEFLQSEKIPKEKIKAYYSIALDDPQIVERPKCRFDACAALLDNVPPKGEVGQKILQGGRFAVFIHRGPYIELEKAFDEIFRFWYPTSQEQLADAISFCEHINAWDPTIPDNERLTKIYIPLANV
ncbi:MAG TPA: helix-turn-helix domain-containing protein [Rhabdochlamydiaceae bacterium]|nr:helix-turn-helix domain-containing protein [Rhabdochlamydiaceae bacterium]